MKIKLTVNGAPVEVEHTELQLPDGAQLIEPGQTPEGFVSREFMQQEIQRRGKNLHRREDLLTDDEFWREAAQQRGVQLGDDGKPVKTKDVDPEKLFQQWEQQHLKPATEKIEKLTGTVSTLREQTLVGQMLQAASQMGLKKAYLTPPADGLEPPVVSMFKSAFGYDEDSGQWAVKEGEGFRYAPNPTQQQKYAGPQHFFDGLKKQEAFKEWFEDRRPNASGFNEPGGGPGGMIRLTQEQARDPRQYRAAKEQAEKAGAQIVVE